MEIPRKARTFRILRPDYYDEIAPTLSEEERDVTFRAATSHCPREEIHELPEEYSKIPVISREKAIEIARWVRAWREKGNGIHTFSRLELSRVPAEFLGRGMDKAAEFLLEDLAKALKAAGHPATFISCDNPPEGLIPFQQNEWEDGSTALMPYAMEPMAGQVDANSIQAFLTPGRTSDLWKKMDIEERCIQGLGLRGHCIYACMLDEATFSTKSEGLEPGVTKDF